MGLHEPDHSFFPEFASLSEATRWFRDLTADTPWRDDKITLFGKTYAVPRRTALYGDPGATYAYSNIHLEPQNWTTLLRKIRIRVEECTDQRFNAVLLNLYRDGNDSNGWHADNELELGAQPVIASLSLGATRSMQFKRRDGLAKWSLDLHEGSLLLMSGDSQSEWLHCIPKQRRIVQPRLNLTFRQVRH